MKTKFLGLAKRLIWIRRVMIWIIMIKNQAEAKGGKKWTESEENKGKRFIINFAA